MPDTLHFSFQPLFQRSCPEIDLPPEQEHHSFDRRCQCYWRSGWCIGLISAMNSNPLFSLYQCPYFSFLSVADFSCSWSWIRWFVLSWSSTLTCLYGTPPAKRPLTNCSMPKSMCKFYSFSFAFAPAWLTALFLFSFLFSYNVHGLILKKIFDRRHFLEYGIQNETQADKVVHIMHIIPIICIISIIHDIY